MLERRCAVAKFFGLFAQYLHMNFDGVQQGCENGVTGNKNTPVSHSAPCDCSSAVGPKCVNEGANPVRVSAR